MVKKEPGLYDGAVHILGPVVTYVRSYGAQFLTTPAHYPDRVPCIWATSTAAAVVADIEPWMEGAFLHATGQDVAEL